MDYQPLFPDNQPIVQVFTCECNPNFNWKNKSTFNRHFKSQRHISFDTKGQELDHRKNITKLQIELDKTKTELNKLKDIYLKLLYAYNDLKSKND